MRAPVAGGPEARSASAAAGARRCSLKLYTLVAGVVLALFAVAERYADLESSAVALPSERELHPGLSSANIHRDAAASLERLLSGGSAPSSGTTSSSSSSALGTCGSHDVYNPTLRSTLAFLFSCFLICSMIDHVNDLVPFEWQCPKSVFMFIVGMLIGVFFLHVTDPIDEHLDRGFNELILGMRGAAYFDPHALLYIVLPPLLYESASEMSWHVLKKVLPSAVLLAIPGVVLNTFLTGAFIKVVVRVDGHSPTWQVSWLLSSVLSATDPVAVVAALSVLGAPKKLSSLIEGESLLNDGSAVVAAYIFRDWVAVNAEADLKYCQGDPPSGGCMVEYFFRMAVGGIAIGLGAGCVLYFWIQHARARSLVLLELALVLTGAYGTFYVAEAAKMSGVLAVVALGFAMSAGLTSRLSHEGRHNHHVILKQMAYSCNQVAFLTSGIVSARFLFTSDSSCDHTYKSGRAWAELVGLYFIIHVSRGLVVLAFWPLLRRWGYGITWKEALVLVYSGLRGVVGLVMGLIVEHYIDGEYAQMVTFHTSGIVLLTLLLNGQTVDGLYRRLRLYPTNRFRMTYLRKVFFRIEGECQKGGIRRLHQDWFFQDCSFRKIIRCVPHFCYINFNTAGVPVPEGIESVRQALRNLEDEATKFRKDQQMVGKMKSIEAGGFPRMWRRRKLESQGKFLELIEKTTEMANLKDSLTNLNNTGDRLLDYTPPEQYAKAGFYVSARSLYTLSKGEDAIDIKFIKLERVTVVLGLVSDPEDIKNLRVHGSQGLGIVLQNSVGFNCATCKLNCNGPMGEEEVELQCEALEQGDVVCLRFSRHSHRVTFQVFPMKNNRTVRSCSCNFGPFTADLVYPVVEFRCSDLAQMAPERSLTKSNSYGTIDLQAVLPGNIAGGAVAAIGGAVKGTSDAVRMVGQEVVGQVSEVFGRVASLGKKAAKAPAETAAAAAAAIASSENSGNGGTSLADTLESGGSELRRYSKSVPPAPTLAKVMLSFEPQLASDAESINELFHVFFNSVMHAYTDMHEHGVLGDTALAWLTEAVGVAMDSANSEVNAMRAMDFLAKQKGAQTIASRLPAPTALEGRPEEEPAQSDATPRGRKMPTKEVMKMITALNQIKVDTNKAKIVGLFEPMVVEYLSLESVTATTCVWDRFPRNWENARLLGYGNTRAKVEALWAFVDVHERVMNESPALERYPDLVHCIKSIVDEARTDLNIFAELQPRRFFYSKHMLALRLLMENKRHRLAKAIQDGQVAAADGEGLVSALRERIVEVDQYRPSVKTKRGFCCNRDVNRLFRRLSSDAVENFDTNNAWDELELPSPLGLTFSAGARRSSKGGLLFREVPSVDMAQSYSRSSPLAAPRSIGHYRVETASQQVAPLALDSSEGCSSTPTLLPPSPTAQSASVVPAEEPQQLVDLVPGALASKSVSPGDEPHEPSS